MRQQHRASKHKPFLVGVQPGPLYCPEALVSPPTGHGGSSPNISLCLCRLPYLDTAVEEGGFSSLICIPSALSNPSRKGALQTDETGSSENVVITYLRHQG